jgi:hypothetical protein
VASTITVDTAIAEDMLTYGVVHFLTFRYYGVG